MKIWIENKVENEIEISFEEIAQKFFNSEIFKQAEKEDRFERLFLLFLADKNGLNCTYEQKDYAPLFEYVLNHKS